MALVTALGVGAVVTLTPANGAASGIATGFVRAVRHLAAPSRAGQAFAGTPAVGALFTASAGRLGQHFCTASVVDSPAGDLVITAAHCVAGASDTIEFVPGYDRGNQPYGVWTVTKVYVDQAWTSSSSDDDDFAFLRVSQPGSSVPVENVTGAERLATGTPASRQMVQVIGYPTATNQPVTCLIAQDQPITKAQGDITADLLKRLGINVDFIATDWGTVGARRAVKAPPGQGGWHMFHTWHSGADIVNPAVSIGIRATGDSGWFGWPNVPEVETEVYAWSTPRTSTRRKRRSGASTRPRSTT